MSRFSDRTIVVLIINHGQYITAYLLCYLGDVMQFRPPFGQPPSDQSWQPQEDPPQNPAQHQVYSQKQWQQLPYSPQYQPLPVMQPQTPKKKSPKRLWLVIAVVVIVLVLASAIGLRGANISTIEGPKATAAQTRIPANAEQPTSQSTPVDTSKTTAGNLKNIKPTHGTPTFEGHISDFFGKYGTPSMTNGKDMVWLLSSDGGLSLDARDTGGGVVGYLSVTTPDSWSKQEVQAYCLGFAPHDYTLDKTSIPKNSSGLYVYDSPNGKFAFHVSSGYPQYCYMNTLA
jgi:hypothetical protein